MQRVYRRRRKSSLLFVLLLLLLVVLTLWLYLLHAALFTVEQRPSATSNSATHLSAVAAERENDDKHYMLNAPVKNTGAEEGKIKIEVDDKAIATSSNASSTLQRLLELGYKREKDFNLDERMTWQWGEEACPPAPVGIPPAALQNKSFAPVAYLTCISNEEFVDGALVLGVSLRRTSLFLQKRVADLVVLITSGRVSKASRRRLHLEGTYDHVFEVPSLAARVSAKATFRDTFDKLYMFNLSMYGKLVFMDADMIALRSMDGLFSSPRLRGPRRVGAIGGHGYFQTGMLVFIPAPAVFDCVYEAYRSGTPPDGYRFVGGSARDGALLRHVFQSHYTPISNAYSRNLNPRYRLDRPPPGETRPIFAVHLRGIVKPWFDKRLPNRHKELGKKEYGFTYLHWWTLYEEEVHKKSAYYSKALEMQNEGHAVESNHLVVDGIPFAVGHHSTNTADDASNVRKNGNGNNDNTHNRSGGENSEGDIPISPLTHVWMQRHSNASYVQLLSTAERKRRNRTLPYMRKIASNTYGLSCDAVCSEEGLRCSHEALQFSSLNDCDELKLVFGCSKCELGVYWRPHPGNDFPALENITGNKNNDNTDDDDDNENNNSNKDAKIRKKGKNSEKNANSSEKLICRYNYLHDQRSIPNCSATYPTTRRYCPCVPKL
ncbi:glycosyl transferase [Trypanosoma theileri]|uniref:Glycosyl transferase n=1 Tax=Trypanosoma theileri TaxID=67003 RepID=A0A1X0NXS4_9TRYP|nr:glycosyl transferase [Trypanosoma theileri]ORC89283.1 glycosyl transferase [Trypanosoma theileri]